MEKVKKNTLLINTMASAILLLDNYYELEDTKLYSNSLKMTGNRFYSELKKKMTPFENMLHRTGEITEAGKYLEVIESIVGNVALFNIKELRMLQSFIEQLKAGDVLDVDADTYAKLKKDEKSVDIR
jgi:hypothetical protein|tara:strand:+ start:11945 stop:12325 length:381 start_codon:yes stop_codon:yes gene_type:complete